METDFAPLWMSLKQHHPDIALILQAHRDTVERYSPEQIADRLRDLSVDYILFDASQSRGTPYNAAEMREYVAAVYRQKLPIGAVVAGGLGAPNSMQQLFGPLVTEYPDLSCDAFLRLQDSSTQALSWQRLTQYLADWRQVTPEAALAAR
jgi:hypothetical protein